MPGSRSYVAASYMLSLDGVACGLVKSVEGGDTVAEVIEEAAGPTYFVKKHVGAPHVEDFVLEIDFAMAQSIYDWIAASWTRNYARKDGSIVIGDANLQARVERQFFNALLTETTVPALDAASKEAAYLSVKLAPEYAKTQKGTGKLTAPAAKQKAFIASNFRLEIAGLDCTLVSRIDPFTIKQKVAVDDIGDARDYSKEPSRLEFPNLRVSLPEKGATTWASWFEDFVVKGNNDDAKEKSGAIVFLASDRKTELGRVNLFNVGIFALRNAPRAQTEAIRSVTADLYVERMELHVGAPRPVRVVEPKPVVRVRG